VAPTANEAAWLGADRHGRVGEAIERVSRGPTGINTGHAGGGKHANRLDPVVGRQFSVTRERIRQIEAKALRKAKHPSRSR